MTYMYYDYGQQANNVLIIESDTSLNVVLGSSVAIAIEEVSLYSHFKKLFNAVFIVIVTNRELLKRLPPAFDFQDSYIILKCHGFSELSENEAS